MRRLFAAIKKELLLLIRDRAGLAILFIMPMVLIFVMTLVQDSVYRTLDDEGIPVIFVNDDQDTLGFRIEEGLRMSQLCDFHDSIDGKKATLESAQNAVNEGKFIIGVVIPKGTTQAIRNDVQNMVNESLGLLENDKVDTQSVEIRLIIDPIAKKSFEISITSQLKEYISSAKTRIMFETFKDQLEDIIPEEAKLNDGDYQNREVVRYKQEYASELIDGNEMKPNAVQHNVPAWSIFAMFFIVIPLVGSILREKQEGSVFRFHTIPASYMLQINAKVIVYVLVCMLQFALMLTIGLFFLPLLGMPTLWLGNSYLGILVVVLGCSFAATGYGVLVGTLATTSQQGITLGSLSILILSALGGIWVPPYVMPEMMRSISEISPLHWALDGFYALFLRGEGLIEILPHFAKLMIFFFCCIGLTTLYNRFKSKT